MPQFLFLGRIKKKYFAPLKRIKSKSRMKKCQRKRNALKLNLKIRK